MTETIGFKLELIAINSNKEAKKCLQSSISNYSILNIISKSILLFVAKVFAMRSILSKLLGILTT
jgi:hypothetical protein